MMLEHDICPRCLRYKKPRYEGQVYCYCSFDGAPTATVTETQNTGGQKHDTGKPQLSLLPATAMAAAARVFEYGAKKYSRYNYKKGFQYTRLVDAAMRHISAFNEGQDNDVETNESHLAHGICCLMMLLDTIELGTSVDDRFKGTK